MYVIVYNIIATSIGASVVIMIGSGRSFLNPQFDKFVVLDLQPAFAFDGRVTSHPVIVVVNTPNEINAAFDTISYSKVGGSKCMNFCYSEYQLINGVFRHTLFFVVQHWRKLDTKFTQKKLF